MENQLRRRKWLLTWTTRNFESKIELSASKKLNEPLILTKSRQTQCESTWKRDILFLLSNKLAISRCQTLATD